MNIAIGLPSKSHPLATNNPFPFSRFVLVRSKPTYCSLAPTDDAYARNLWFEAGWAKKWGDLTEMEAVSLVTTNVESILGLQDVMTAKRQRNNFVIFEGSPMEFGSAVAVIVEETGAGRGVTDCWPAPE